MGLADWAFLLCLTLGVNAMVWNDTVIDGVAAEETKANPSCGADVQAWQQFCLMGCAIAVSAASVRACCQRSSVSPVPV